MNVTVRLFAAYADAIGAGTASLTLPDRPTVADVRAAVAALSRAIPVRPIIAVNESYATDDTAVSATDDIAVIPPVAGG
ncbi:MAG: MoaD/ThiS family protein [Gemmatimonadota bacterium]|nr:MoaD/ThiS family protein [Gemmatimonadota bacterium]